MSKSKSYYGQTRELSRQLNQVLSHDEIRALHHKRPWLHFVILFRQLLLLVGCAWINWNFTQWYVWIPSAILLGFTVFNFTVLLHEHVHSAIFVGSHPGWMRFLGWLYAFPSGISANQFRRWHLDHHDNLGSSTEDPKRFHLSPKRNARWYKLLYCTPALFPIYFRAAARETAQYPDELRSRIAKERRITIVGHLLILATIWWLGGFGVAARVYLVPYFLVFPIAFTLNRLGQHYFIDPSDPAKWSSRVDGNFFWHFIFLWSNFHLEHHYFQSVPFYNLTNLNRRLRPFFAERGVENRGYAAILWGWFVRNRQPHTNWSDEDANRRRVPSPAS